MYKFLNTSIKKIIFFIFFIQFVITFFFVGPCWSWLFLIFGKSFIKDVWHNFEYVSDTSLASLFLLLNISNIFIQCFYYFIAFFIILLLVRYFFELKKWQSIYSNYLFPLHGKQFVLLWSYLWRRLSSLYIQPVQNEKYNPELLPCFCSDVRFVNFELVSLQDDVNLQVVMQSTLHTKKEVFH